IEISELHRVIQIEAPFWLLRKCIVHKNVIVGRYEQDIAKFICFSQLSNQCAVVTAAAWQFSIQDLSDEKNQILGDDAQPSTVLQLPVSDVEMSEGLLAHEREVRKTKHFFERWKCDVGDVAAFDIETKHFGEKAGQLAVHLGPAPFKVG